MSVFITLAIIFLLFFIIVNFLFDIIHDCVKYNTFYVKQDHQRNKIESYRILISCILCCFFPLLQNVKFGKLDQKTLLRLFSKKLLPKNNLCSSLINLLSLSLVSINLNFFNHIKYKEPWSNQPY